MGVSNIPGIRTRSLVFLLFFVAITALVQFAVAQGLTAEQVAKNPSLVHTRLRISNPNYRDQGQFELSPDLGLIGDFTAGGVTDLSPLKGVPFGALDLKGLQVSDLTPLKGMPLKVLGLEETSVTDLHPLAGMRLGKLYLNGTGVSDLSPLKGMPITELMLVGTLVNDLRPLRGMPVQQLWLNGSKVQSIAPLAECPLVSLTLEGTAVSDLHPLAKMSTLARLHIAGTKVNDVTPLKGLKLQRLIFTPNAISVGLDAIRGMKTITEIGTTLETRMPPTTFWQQYDQGRTRR